MLAQFGLAVLVLGFASYTDIKTRTADNWLWLLLFCGGLFFSVVGLGVGWFLGVYVLFGVFILIGMFGVWFVASDFVGAADVKAVMALGFCVPLLIPFMVCFLVLFLGGWVGFVYVRFLKNKNGGEGFCLRSLAVPLMPFLFVSLVCAGLVYLFM
jgi:Flp pilus assembly protein protease CpaA